MGALAIEMKLRAAQERLKKVTAALARKHKGGELEAYRHARAEVLELERELAATRGEEYAVTIDFPVKWDTGATLPHVLANDYRCFVTFYVAVVDPDWDGTYATMVNPADEIAQHLAVVEFKFPASMGFGSPNDEGLDGHPLYGKGLEPYEAQIVENSRRIAELKAISKAHGSYHPERWDELKHYVLWFHDKTFECIARGYQVDVYHESMSSLLDRVAKRLLGK